MNVNDLANTIHHIALLPPDVAMLETTILPAGQAFIGRG
jgi:hypothetical protein